MMGTTDAMTTVSLFSTAYLLGSVNFAILLFRILSKDDPRDSFSGNAGTTNVYRQAGMSWSIVVLLLDLGRAMAVAWAALYFLGLNGAPWVGLALVIGNGFPCLHQFRGGKGVASYLGFTLLIAPWATALSALVWMIVYGLVRTPFIASFFMVAVLAGGTSIACNLQVLPTAGAILTALLIFYHHRRNIAEWRRARNNSKDR